MLHPLITPQNSQWLIKNTTKWRKVVTYDMMWHLCVNIYAYACDCVNIGLPFAAAKAISNKERNYYCP